MVIAIDFPLKKTWRNHRLSPSGDGSGSAWKSYIWAMDIHLPAIFAGLYNGT